MDVESDPLREKLPGPVAWSFAVGGCALLVGVLSALVLFPVLRVLATVLASVVGLPITVVGLLFLAPIPVFGTTVWFLVAERGGPPAYWEGGVAGALTAASIVALWVGVFALVLSSKLVIAGSLLVVFVASVLLPGGLVAGLAGVYLRRRSDRA
jgi:hypothetical protein